MKIALTFDDIPIHEPLPSNISRLDISHHIISTLKKNKISEACGFVNSSMTFDTKKESTKSIIDIWANSNFELGNHGANHLNLNTTESICFLNDIDQNSKYLKSNYPKAYKNNFFRYPYLAEGENKKKQLLISKELKIRNLNVAKVSMNFGDWAWNFAYSKAITKNAYSRIKELDDLFLFFAKESIKKYSEYSEILFKRQIPFILLLHNGAFTAKKLESLIRIYKDAGASFISLKKALSDPAYHHPKNTFVKSGYTWLHQMLHYKNIKTHNIDEIPEKTLSKILKDLS